MWFCRIVLFKCPNANDPSNACSLRRFNSSNRYNKATRVYHNIKLLLTCTLSSPMVVKNKKGSAYSLPIQNTFLVHMDMY